MNGIQRSWVQIPLGQLSIAASKNPSVVYTIYIYIYNAFYFKLRVREIFLGI